MSEMMRLRRQSLPTASPQSPSPRRKLAIRQALIFLVPTLAAFGPLATLTGGIYLFRIAVVTLFLTSLLERPPVTSALQRASLHTAVLWSGYGLFLAFFALDFSTAINEWSSIVIGMLLVAAVLRGASQRADFTTLLHGWVLAIFIVGGIGTYELVSGQHLPNYLSGVADREYVLTSLAFQGQNLIAGPFGNPNAFALFLTASMAVLLARARQATRLAAAILWSAASAWVLVLLTATGSRLALAAAVVSVLVWLILNGSRSIRTLAAMISGAALALIAGWPSPLIFTTATAKITDLISLSTNPGTATTDESGLIRLDLVRAGAEMIYATWGLGVGPGNYPVWIVNRLVETPSSPTLSPHNAVVELLAQYGIVVFAAVTLLSIRVLRIAWGRATGFESNVRALVLSTVAAFPLACSVNSTFWTAPTTWTLVALLLLGALLMEKAEAHDTLLRTKAAPE